MNNIDYLKEPLTIEEIKELSDENNYIEGIVAIKEIEIFYNEFENILDLMSYKLCNSPCLMDIQYKMIRCIPENNIILYSVSGDATSIIE